MVPRTELVWLDVSDSAETIRDKLSQDPAGCYPVCQGSPDRVLGIVFAQDLLLQLLAGQPIDVSACVRAALVVPPRMTALQVLEAMRRSHSSLAPVADEDGGLCGLLPVSHFLAISANGSWLHVPLTARPPAQGPDGSWLLDGRLRIQVFHELMGLADLRDIPAKPISDFGRFHLPPSRPHSHIRRWLCLARAAHRRGRDGWPPRRHGAYHLTLETGA